MFFPAFCWCSVTAINQDECEANGRHMYFAFAFAFAQQECAITSLLVWVYKCHFVPAKQAIQMKQGLCNLNIAITISHLFLQKNIKSG